MSLLRYCHRKSATYQCLKSDFTVIKPFDIKKFLIIIFSCNKNELNLFKTNRFKRKINLRLNKINDIQLNFNKSIKKILFFNLCLDI